MSAYSTLLIVRLAPVVFVTLAAAAWFNEVQEGGPWVARNLLPLGLLIVLSWLSLHRGAGKWTGTDWRLPLGVLGFAIPAFGLSTYLHYAYSVNLNGMFDQGPGELFRFLPVYTVVAGGIGFAIGWIVGRNVV
ncbi:MAG: hypothetical protein OER97_00340 [Gammaproteobacteria bacterium]|nr:hypothetical protein [Gammaproteobacteria bacterium]